MKVATVIVTMNKLGSTVKLPNVTPAEAALLATEHRWNCAGDPVKIVSGTEEEVFDFQGTEWTPDVELARLLSKYNEKKVRSLYPGTIPALPTSFEQALRLGTTAQRVETNAVDVKG